MTSAMTLNQASGVPFHEQIVEQLCAALAGDGGRDLDQLPTVSDLARRLLVSPRTVDRAFVDLEKVGLVRQDGAGRWVFTEGASVALHRWQQDRGRKILARALNRTEQLGACDGIALITEADAMRRAIELEQARDLQLSMLPAGPPTRDGFEVAVAMTPAGEVGGDYYDFFARDGGPLWAVVGDATGHGVAAGMMVAMTKACLQAVSAETPSEAMSRSNAVLRSTRGRRLFMALAILQVSPGQLSVVSAGMPPVLIRRAATGDVEEVLVPGLPLGNAMSDSYPMPSLDVFPGDVAVAMSDGLPELENSSGEQLGFRRIRAALADTASCSAVEIVRELETLAEQWRGQRMAEDDMTLMVVRWCDGCGEEATDG